MTWSSFLFYYCTSVLKLIINEENNTCAIVFTGLLSLKTSVKKSSKHIVYAFIFKSSVQLLSCVQLFVTPWTAARQASLSIANSRSLPKLMPIESVMPSPISSSVVPFSSCPQSFPASGSFSMSQFFASGGQSIGGSASVLAMNIQDQLPLGWTGLISLQSKGLSRVFSNNTVQKLQLFSAHQCSVDFLYSPTLTSIHDYWKTHSLD